MDQNQNTTTPNQTPNTNPDKSIGPLIGIIIIVIVLIIGALYFWGSALNKKPPINIGESVEIGATTSDQVVIPSN